MIRKLLLTFAAGAAISTPATAADQAPVRLAVKPLLCVIDKAASMPERTATVTDALSLELT